MSITIFLFPIVIALVAAWNFYSPFRAKLRGWSTILEGLIGTVFAYFGIFADALEEGQRQGYIPENFVQYVPIILLAWIVIKRVQTKTPVGGK